jgi:alanyl-tRNA synthetase
MTSAQIRQSFLDFFREKEHTIVPSSSLLPSSPNLLFTNAGMNQFVPYFLGTEKPPFSPARAADTQKCIRAGGKHNDLDEVGRDTYHHTFFEMLGNWSFGDYFKAEAITWAWELLVKRWKFPPRRLYATVYKPAPGDPSAFDQESYGVWARLFREAGMDPAVHIISGSRKDNFWMMGETGPCGPCSEIHMDLTQAGDTKGSLVNKGDPRCMEIWNLVFIQYNANPDGTFTALPARHVDTGMGFERVAAIIGCTRNLSDFARSVSNYDTDVFRPIFNEIARLSGKKYASTLPEPGSSGGNEQERIDIAFRVVGDHLRTLCFAIADGIQPSNTDRGYVLRRILRRAVRYGRQLGLGGTGMPSFLADLANSVLLELGSVFPELAANPERIRTTLATEEEAFAKTLDNGNELFKEELSRIKAAGAQDGFPAETAFKLYDTYGFPVDLTQLMAREEGLALDTEAVERLMEAQRERARSAQKKEVVGAPKGSEMTSDVETEFLGYNRDTCVGSVQEIVADGGNVYVVVNRSTFYAEMGGQVGDAGLILGSANRRIPVSNTIARGKAQFLRLANPADQSELPVGRVVSLEVDPARRRTIEGHHTATHLLHWALHEVVGPDATQRGSYVGPDRLRFDFNSAPLTPAQVEEVEALVNQHAIANEPVTWVEVPFASVRGRPDIMQFFGDKYGETVRVVQIGGVERKLDGFSMELCAGTHLRSTGQLGAFKITSEGAISAGVRRIEAVAGQALLRYYEEQAREQSRRVQELEEKLSGLGKAQQKEKAEAARQLAEAFVTEMWPKIDQGAPVPRLVEKVELGESGPDVLTAVIELLKQRGFRGVAVLAGAAEGAAHFAVAVSQEFTGRFKAGELLQQLAPIVDGKGGGRADLARGAGKNPAKIPDLLWRAGELLA